MRKLKDILIENNFRFNHNLGQNFISDTNFLNKIVEHSGVMSNDVVVEIGTGAGTLTRALAAVAKKVYSFEVDERLQPILNETLQGLENVEVIFKDILSMSDSDVTAIVPENFKVVANIPYYITTALVMRFLESELKPQTITVMVQKEVANRFVAKKDTADYGAITMAISLYGEASIVDQVSQTMFFPVPKVDSSLVRIDLSNKYCAEDKALLQRLIKSAFAMRRKTFTNNLVSSFNITRTEAEQVLTELGFDVRIRGEVLGIDDMVMISKNATFLSIIKSKKN
ncbi:MAG: 16S rRNA (adenine(1518)-N(6)/adenine(1519)-N(6))-dimethyltransferase RsmA [Clostridia bacterium]